MADTIEEAWTKTINANTNIIALIGNNKVFYIDAPQAITEPYITLFKVNGDDTAVSLCEKYAGSPILQLNIFTKGIQNGKIENLIICKTIIDEYQYFYGTIEGIIINETRLTHVGIRKDPDYEDIYIGSVEIATEYVKP